MLYHLFDYLSANFDLPGSGLMRYLSFRSVLAVVTSLLIVIFIGKSIINALRRRQIGEDIRDLGLEGQLEKKGTPTMGGIIILLGIIIPVLLFARLDNIYTILMLVATVWCGILGFADDYIKVFKHDKQGLSGKFKIIGQIGLGLIVGTVMCFSEDVVIREDNSSQTEKVIVVNENGTDEAMQMDVAKTTKTTIPFVKDNEFDYSWLVGGNTTLAWILYVLIAIFIITAVSNGANLTDGLDGLLTGVSIPVVGVLAILAYLSGNVIYADYLNIMYIPNSGELLIFGTAMLGALIGFLWYNAYPAQIFMGDTGSLAIGGVIATFALCIRKELLLPLLCGVFLAEAVSVMMQVGYFKYSRKKYGEPRRLLLMSPLHHHYQKQGIFETKIMIRFMIVSIILAALTIGTLKVR